MMLKIVIPCALALMGAAPAIAAPMKLERGKIACTDLADHQKWVTLLGSGLRSPDNEAASKFMARAMDDNRCFDMPAGTEVFLDKEIGLNMCLRPRGKTDCVWSLVSTMESNALKRPLSPVRARQRGI
jgi:hypothetical protein